MSIYIYVKICIINPYVHDTRNRSKISHGDKILVKNFSYKSIYIYQTVILQKKGIFCV